MQSSKTDAAFLKLYLEFYSWFLDFSKPKSLAKVIILRLHSILMPNSFSLHNLILPSCGQMSPSSSSSFPCSFFPFTSQIYPLRLYPLSPFQLFAYLCFFQPAISPLYTLQGDHYTVNACKIKMWVFSVSIEGRSKCLQFPKHLYSTVSRYVPHVTIVLTSLISLPFASEGTLSTSIKKI